MYLQRCMCALSTIFQSEKPKLYTIFAFQGAIGLSGYDWME